MKLRFESMENYELFEFIDRAHAAGEEGIQRTFDICGRGIERS
jgi:hypothetical protein